MLELSKQFPAIILTGARLGINESSIASSPFLGQLWETLVCAEFRRRIKNSDQYGALWFYRDKRAREIDFVYEQENKLDFFEVKWTSEPLAKSIHSMTEIYKDMSERKKTLIQLGETFLLCRASNSYPFADNSQVTNLEYFLRPR
ncbi:MAG: DUF4143 domain-containing protein [Gammaproteobacteria bacterium]|nr:DUF4143 domain-containing protein [Gammaproteobacteria bacterium]MDH5691647.1 DUF4143 domain-containing protein [Gammaproteobacteria bacterium]